MQHKNQDLRGGMLDIQIENQGNQGTWNARGT